MKLRIDLSIFLMLLLLSGGFSMDTENKILELDVLEIQQADSSSSGGSSRSSQRIESKPEAEKTYPIERIHDRLILGSGGGAVYFAEVLAGDEYNGKDRWIVDSVYVEDEEIVKVRNGIVNIHFQATKLGGTTVTTKVYNKNNTNITVITKIPITVTDSVYGE